MNKAINLTAILLILLGLNSCVVLSEKDSITIYGCSDSTALNYIEQATVSDGSCEYILGCTNENADNYNSSATTDDNTCTYTSNVVFYSDGSWIPLGHNESRIQIFEKQSRVLLQTISSNENSDYSNENCKNYSDIATGGRLLGAVLVEPNKTEEYLVKYVFYHYDDNGNFVEEEYERAYALKIPNEPGYCTFYNLTF